MPGRLSAQAEAIASKVKQFDASKENPSRAERLQLIQSLEKLTLQLKDPKEAIFDHLTNKTTARLMRILTVTGIFEMAGPDEYAHTPYSLAYIEGHEVDFLKLCCDEILVNTSRLPEYFRAVGGRDSTSMTENLFSWGNNKPGSSFFEIISQDPRRIKQFDIAMSTQDSTLPVLGMYPFGEELANAPDLENRAVLVDIGGGRGQSLLQIKQKWPQLQGRLILQDRPMVLDSCPDLPGIEKMPHDFFTEQPVKHAHAYYIRRCLHNWTDEHCAKILKAIVPAMASDSRVLIGEMVVPEYNSVRPGGVEDMAPYWMDHNMFAFGGRERTRSDFERLVTESGLKLVKVWQSEASSQAVLEARMKMTVISYDHFRRFPLSLPKPKISIYKYSTSVSDFLSNSSSCFLVENMVRSYILDNGTYMSSMDEIAAFMDRISPKTCDGVCLPHGLARLMNSINYPIPDNSIQLRCIKFNQVVNEWKYRHPALLVLNMIQGLYRIMKLDPGPIPYYVEYLDKSNYFFASLGLMRRVMLRFKQVCPATHVNILIEHTGPYYKWPEELAMFLHVLSQMTRHPSYMPRRLKVVMAGSDAFMDDVWYSFRGMIKEEIKTKDMGLVDLEAQMSIYLGDILYLQWHERSKKHHRDEMPRGEEWTRDADEKYSKTFTLGEISDFVRQVGETGKCKPMNLDFSDYTHPDREKSVTHDLIHDAVFMNWAKADTSGFCVINGQCSERSHQGVGCDNLRLVSEFSNSVLDPISTRDYAEIRLYCVDYNTEGDEWEYRHTCCLVAALIYELIQLLPFDSCKRIKIKGRNLDKDLRNHDLFLSIFMLEEIVKLFSKSLPTKHVAIFIERVTPMYPWKSSLSIFLHVLSQITRLPGYMPERLKIIVIGNDWSRNEEFWNHIRKKVIEEFKDRVELLGPKTAFEQLALFFSRELHLNMIDPGSKDEPSHYEPIRFLKGCLENIMSKSDEQMLVPYQIR
ncbi:hypothetical protein UA08_03435 [Talaromyces atroroseus]|uniref:O-methyltransferase C-terminal domain-containing protein n=1 Tax=Talaromyces atroroseus TaxID=1441469 RepID=A0A225AWF6_TALAT|nr:hypothetical protein UA08_03435 [Talaromyces atroroseus]OKL61648.1 hypothetical protein UA08_03435 [Talaromyces atroroseus]